MQVESFKVFCDLVDTASFSKAAKMNGITQSAVSQQIKALEKRYQVVFFERGRKNFSITPEGQVFEGVARHILEIMSGLRGKLEDIRNVVGGTLRIASVFSVGLHELPEVNAKFRKKFPEVDLGVDYLQSNQVYLEVIEGRADFGLVAYPKIRKGVVVEEFASDRLVVVCGAEHELASRKRVKLADLSGVEFISFAADLPTRKAIDRKLRDAGVRVRVRMEFDNVETVKRAVAVENAVSILPRKAVEREEAGGELCIIEVQGADMRRPLGIVKRRTRVTTPPMREYGKMLHAIAG